MKHYKIGFPPKGLIAFSVIMLPNIVNLVSPVMFLGMAVFPCCFLIAFILWQKIYPALIPAATFSTLHIGITAFHVL